MRMVYINHILNCGKRMPMISRRMNSYRQLKAKELARIVKEGLDKKALLAALNYYEFKYREADFGSYPKGIDVRSDEMFDSWLYDDKMAFDMIEANDIF